LDRTPTARRARPAPWSDRVCDGACLVFALWTVCAHAAVAWGASLRQLVVAFAVLGALLAVVYATVRGLAGAPTLEGVEEDDPRLHAPPRLLLRAAGVVVGGAALALAFAGGTVAVWTAVVAVLAAAAAFVLPARPWLRAPREDDRHEIALLGLAVACAVLALVVHRPDLDDSFYVALATAAADHPDRALLAGDPLHAGHPLYLPVYRLHGWEPLVGALSWLTGIPAILGFHVVAAALVAFLAPLAAAHLFRDLAPRRWLGCTLAWVVVLLAMGEEHRAYGNFGFVRAWQGKGALLLVLLPLVTSQALRFARRPTPGRLGLLACGQIAAVGVSASALWAAPVAALLGAASAVRPTPRGVGVVAASALAALYPVAAGLLLRGDMQGIVEAQIRAEPPGARLGAALAQVLGDGRLRAVSLAAVALAWTACARDLGRRYAVVAPLGVLLVLLSPWTGEWVRHNVTGASYWRALWALPVPVLTALLLAAPLEWERGRRRRLAALAGFAALLAAYVAFVPRHTALSPENAGAGGVGIRFAMPGPKVPPERYREATLVNESVPAGAAVVVPPDVAPWVTVQHDHAAPVEVRPIYLRHLALSSEAIRMRQVMARYVAGDPRVDGGGPLFRDGLRRLDVRAALVRESPYADEVRRHLEAEGFERSHAWDGGELWVLP